MKKLFILLLLPFCGFSQSGVIDPTGFYIPKVTTLATCNTEAKGKAVFLIADNKLYVCNGTAWVDVANSGFTIPYSTTSSLLSGDLFKLTNTGTARGIHSRIDNINNPDFAIYGYSNGTGAAARFYSNNTNGDALQTYGKIQFSNNSEGAGKILTSDASGNATWQNYITDHKVAFAAYGLSDGDNDGTHTFTQQVYNLINFRTQDYDFGNDFDLATDTFTAPYNGIYHFDVQLKYWYFNLVSGYWYSLSIWTNDNFNRAMVYASTETSSSAMLSVDISLLVGMTVSAKVFPNTSNSYSSNAYFYADDNLARFSGHLVTKL